MKQHWILLIVLIPLLSSISLSEGSSSVTTESLVNNHGYPFEKHQVQTSDGYILALHRIPHSARVSTPEPRPVAFLMHGLITSSSDWVLLGPDNGLAYILSDAGYDVWMGNARGNRFSRNHITHSPLSKSFWNFDWHEIGMIDLPAMIDYVRFHTGKDQVRYFGHSQGTTTFFLLNSLNLKFKNHIKSAHLLAPVAFSDHAKSLVAKILATLLGHPNALAEFLGNMEFLPNTRAQELIGYTACKNNSLFQILCSNLIFLVAGFNPESLNTKLLPTIFATTPAGASMKQLIHYLQNYKSGYFRPYDYGPNRNLITYGSKEPPNYPLEKIDVPIFLYYSNNDYLSSVIDVHRLIHQLSNSTLRRAYKVPNPKWAHFDYLWGLNVKEQLYDAVMEDVASIK